MEVGSAFHYCELLPQRAATGDGTPPRSVAEGFGTSAATLSIRSTRICVHARTCPPSDQRTGEGESLGRDSGAQARLRATALSYFPQKANGTTQNYSKIVLRGTSGKGASTISMCGARANASRNYATSTATQSSADW